MSFDLSTTTNLMNNSLLTLHRNSNIDINRIRWIHCWIWFHIISMFYRINSHFIIRFIAHPNDSHQDRKYLFWKHICQHYHLNIDSQYEWYHITNSYSSMKSYTSFSSINRISPHLENSFIQSIYTLSNSSSINPSFPFIWVSYDVHLHWFQYLIWIWYLRINNRMDWINTKWFLYGMSEMFKWIKKYHIQHIAYFITIIPWFDIKCLPTCIHMFIFIHYHLRSSHAMKPIITY